MKIICDPDLFFINSTDWFDEDKRDFFLENLLDHLNLIEKYELGRFIVSPELEEMLWENPLLPPWRHDSDYSNTLVPRIAQAFFKLSDSVEVSTQRNGYLLEPALHSSYGTSIYSMFLDLLFDLSIGEGVDYMVLGNNNGAYNNIKFTFVCKKDNDVKVATNLVYSIDSWIKNEQVIEVIANRLVKNGEIADINNLFPNTEIVKRLKPSMDELREDAKDNTSERFAISLNRGKLVALLNGYVYTKEISDLNNRSALRYIYTSGTGNKQVYLSIDVKSLAYEVCSHDGTHLGEWNFEGEQTKRDDTKGKHDIRVK